MEQLPAEMLTAVVQFIAIFQAMVAQRLYGEQPDRRTGRRDDAVRPRDDAHAGRTHPSDMPLDGWPRVHEVLPGRTSAPDRA